MLSRAEHNEAADMTRRRQESACYAPTMLRRNQVKQTYPRMRFISETGDLTPVLPPKAMWLYSTERAYGSAAAGCINDTASW